MRFKTTEEHTAWLETDRTHEECSGCLFEWTMPAPCKGHPAGPTSCREKGSLINKAVKAAESDALRCEALCNNAPVCPKCDSTQIQLIEYMDTVAKWKCRHCRTKFYFELIGG